MQGEVPQIDQLVQHSGISSSNLSTRVDADGLHARWLLCFLLGKSMHLYARQEQQVEKGGEEESISSIIAGYDCSRLRNYCGTSLEHAGLSCALSSADCSRCYGK